MRSAILIASLLVAALTACAGGSGEGTACTRSTDCAQGAQCVDGYCARASDAGAACAADECLVDAALLEGGSGCSDGRKDGDESDVDCGGSCPPCGSGAQCVTPADCASRLCTQGLCPAPTCSDGVENQDESDVDCGGSCPGCDLGGACQSASDCASGVCAGTCVAPSCHDGMKNEDESDVDCGGSCPPCQDCSTCVAATDCAHGRCASGVCRMQQEIYVDWVAHCSTDGSASYQLPGVPAGNYQVTALDSAATVWDPPYTPPTSGWFYTIPCTGLSVPMVRTPAGTYYATAAAAFASLMATSQEAAFAGGTLVCPVRDSNCGDNHGGVRFTLERNCP